MFPRRSECIRNGTRGPTSWLFRPQVSAGEGFCLLSGQSYTLIYSRKESEGVYLDAEFKIKGSTFKAAKIGFKDTPSWVKVVVLEGVK
jgi:hypothetical protein